MILDGVLYLRSVSFHGVSTPFKISEQSLFRMAAFDQGVGNHYYNEPEHRLIEPSRSAHPDIKICLRER